MGDGFKRIVVPVFKGEEKAFPLWRKRIEQYFKVEKLLHTLEKTPEEEDFFQPVAGASAEAEAERKASLDARLKQEDSAVNMLLLALDDTPMGHVLQCSYAKEIMTKLIQIYQKHGPIAMLGLRSRLYTLKEQRCKSLRELFTKHEELVGEIESLGEAVSSAEKLNTLLVAIPEQFNHIIGALTVTRKDDLNLMSLAQVQRIFLDAEESCNSQAESAAESLSAQQVAMMGKQSKQENDITCFKCGKTGHISRNCKQTKRDYQYKQRDIALMVRIMDEYPVTTSSFFQTYLDSGASQHMFRDETIFHELWECEGTEKVRVELAQEGATIMVKKMGNAYLRARDQRRLQLNNVYFVPELTANLISVSRIESSGKSVIFQNNRVQILDEDGTLIITGRKVDRLYVLDLYRDENVERVFTCKVVAYENLDSQNNEALPSKDEDTFEGKDEFFDLKMIDNNGIIDCAKRGHSPEVPGPPDVEQPEDSGNVAPNDELSEQGRSENNFERDIQQRMCDFSKFKNWSKWKQAIDEVLGDLQENNERALVSELPEGRKAINSRWLFSVKNEIDSMLINAILDRGSCMITRSLLKPFKMADSGEVDNSLGFLNARYIQRESAVELCEELLGSPIYLVHMYGTSNSVNIFSLFQSFLEKGHGAGRKRELRYVQETGTNLMVPYRLKDAVPPEEHAETDALTEDVEEQRSMIYEDVISWRSTRQPIDQGRRINPFTETELATTCNVSEKGVWMSSILSDVGVPFIPFTIYEDNIRCIRIAKEPREHQRMKHIEEQ